MSIFPPVDRTGEAGDIDAAVELSHQTNRLSRKLPGAARPQDLRAKLAKRVHPR
ncbi:hypothetical protein KCP73_20375 [Salmonella enterica subsp. enterica]|nr:hypothetical protein KCP73_20375 [Salmonella enterica subsp. enterica]